MATESSWRRAAASSWRWAGVPFYIRAGKCLPLTCTEVHVDLKAPPQALFPKDPPHAANFVRFRLSPDVAIGQGARIKAPGEGMVGVDDQGMIWAGNARLAARMGARSGPVDHPDQA